MASYILFSLDGRASFQNLKTMNYIESNSNFCVCIWFYFSRVGLQRDTWRGGGVCMRIVLIVILKI
jgi:hypothetical protein